MGISPHVRQEATIPTRVATDRRQKGDGIIDSINATSENEIDSEKNALAKKRRLRGSNETCLLPTHLLHRLRAGPGGASCITFSPSGNLLAFAACGEPLPGKVVDLFQNEFKGRRLPVLNSSAYVTCREYTDFLNFILHRVTLCCNCKSRFWSHLRSTSWSLCHCLQSFIFY